MTTTADVPGRYDIAISGLGFMLFEEPDQPAIIHQSIRQQREQASGANANIGENTVNPEGFWRRSRDGWHHGAGQTYGDRAESDDLRFRSSQGVNVFDVAHEVSLLHDMTLAYDTSAASQNAFFVVAGDLLYWRGDTSLVRAANPASSFPWTTTPITGFTLSASYAEHSLATDGNTVYIATDSGIYTATAASTVASSFITGTSIVYLWYAKGRLIVNNSGQICNPVTAGTLPSPFFTVPTGFFVNDVAEGPNHIYILASSGNKAVVYKTQVKADGTALDVPTVAAEIVGVSGVALFGYAGRMFLITEQYTGTFSDTNRVLQMAEVDANGNLVLGSTIAAGTRAGGMTCVGMVGQSRFVWFPQSRDLTAGPKLARLDLSVATLPVTPAYASDLELPSGTSVDQLQQVTALARIGGKLIMAVGHEGAWVENDDYVDVGYIYSGLWGVDLADTKTPVAVDMEAGFPSDSSIAESLSVNRGASFTTIDTFDSGDTGEAPITGIAASRNFELLTALIASTDNNDTPTLYRHTLKVEPGVSQGDYVIFRLRLYEAQVDNTGSSTGRTPLTDLAALEALQASRAVVQVQEGSRTYNATVRDLDFEAHSRCASADDGSWNGVATCRVKKIPA